MQFVDEFRDPELAKSLLQRLQKIMENQPHFYARKSVIFDGGLWRTYSYHFLNLGWIVYYRKALNLFTVQGARCVYYRWDELMSVLRLLVAQK